MRSRFLTKLINREVEAYLARRDVIFVPVGTTEMHGGMPLDCETVLPEAIAMLMAQRADGLVLPHLPYFYAGATANGRGTLQMSIRAGYDYLYSVAKALIKQGFRRIVFVSYHAPAKLTIAPVVRDLFTETHVPVLYVDAFLSLYQYITSAEGKHIDMSGEHAYDIHLAAYDLLGRLEDVPLTTSAELDCSQPMTQPNGRPNVTGRLSGEWPMYYTDEREHMPTPVIANEQIRSERAANGKNILEQFMDWSQIDQVVEQMAEGDRYHQEVFKKYPWL